MRALFLVTWNGCLLSVSSHDREKGLFLYLPLLIRPLIPRWGSTLTASSNPVASQHLNSKDHHIEVCGFSIWFGCGGNIWSITLPHCSSFGIFQGTFWKEQLLLSAPLHHHSCSHNSPQFGFCPLMVAEITKINRDLSVTSGVYSSVLILDLSWAVQCWWSFISSWFPPLVSEKWCCSLSPKSWVSPTQSPLDSLPQGLSM